MQNASEEQDIRDDAEDGLDTPRSELSQTGGYGEDLQETHARLLKQLRERELKDEIDEMRRRLAGSAPARPIGNETAVHAGHKRAASQDLEHAHHMRPPSFRPATPPSFEGKHLKELGDYEAGWKIYFNVIRVEDPKDRVNMAATYLKAYARDAWGRLKEHPETWEGFLRFLRSIVVDPANRIVHASWKLRKAEQGKYQSVREFVKYIEELEKDIPEWDLEKQKAHDLLNGLRPNIRLEVMRENKEITSREQVISAAQRQEELLAQSDRSRERQSQEDARERHTQSTRSAYGPFRGRGGSSRGGSRGSYHRETNHHKETTTQGREPRFDPVDNDGCYNCGRKGHIARECRASRKDRQQTAGEAHASSKPKN